MSTSNIMGLFVRRLLKANSDHLKLCVMITVLCLTFVLLFVYRYYTTIPSEFNQKWTNMYRMGVSKMVHDASYVVSKVKGIDEVEANRLVRDYMLPEKGQLPGWIADFMFDTVPVRCYNPLINSSTTWAGGTPAIVYFHGGGWVAGSIEQYHHHIVRFSQEINTIVFSVDYRLAPQFKFPAGFNDTVTALTYLMTNSEDYGINPERVTVMGDSAGANLAAALTLWWRDNHKQLKLPPIKAQVLIYPPLQAINLNTPSYQQNARKGLVLSQKSMVEYWAYYAQGKSTDTTHYLLHQHIYNTTAARYADVMNPSMLPDEFFSDNYHQVQYQNTDDDLASELEPIVTDPRYAPLMASDFSNLPATYLMSCFYDVLRDDGAYFAEQLTNAGVEIRYNQVKAGYHGIFWRLYLEDGMSVYEDAVKFIAQHL